MEKYLFIYTKLLSKQIFYNNNNNNLLFLLNLELMTDTMTSGDKYNI